MRYRLRQPVEQYEFAPPVRFSPGLTGVSTISNEGERYGFVECDYIKFIYRICYYRIG